MYSDPYVNDKSTKKSKYHNSILSLNSSLTFIVNALSKRILVNIDISPESINLLLFFGKPLVAIHLEFIVLCEQTLIAAHLKLQCVARVVQIVLRLQLLGFEGLRPALILADSGLQLQ